MADAPATPVRAGGGSAAVKVAMPSLYGLSSSTKLHRSSVYEPSPASTYGETTLGDSSPVTPQEQGKAWLEGFQRHPCISQGHPWSQ